MTRIGSDMAAALSKPLRPVGPGRMQSTGKAEFAESGGRANEVNDTVTMSKQARALATGKGTKTGQANAAPAQKVDLNSGVAQVKKATAALQSIPPRRMRYVFATGTVLMPGKTTTVDING